VQAGLDVPQQRGDVLAYVMIARALPERFGAPVVVPDGLFGDPRQFDRSQLHRGISACRNAAPGAMGG
jgi:hypothetical protein